MADERRTLEERIQWLLDGRLGDEERKALEQELESRPELRRQLESMRWLKGATGEALRETCADEGLHGRLTAALDRADAEEAGPAPLPVSRFRGGWLAAAAVAILAVAVTLFYGTRTTAPEFPLVVAADMHDLEEGHLALQMETPDVEKLSAFFIEQGIDFPTRVFDLGMMNLTLVGGAKHRFGGGPSAAFVYKGPESLRVLCQMYRGTIDDLPPTDDVREHDGIKFYSYQVGCVSMTFWREGDVICVLASMGDLEDVVALAFAKAVKV